MATFDEKFEAICRNGTLPGAVMCATNVDGSFRYEKAFKGSSSEPIDNNYELDSVFHLASCTKLLTTVAALQCVEKGLIGLDDPVSKWLPELGELKVLLECEEGDEPVFEDVKTPITLRHLLTHSAGLSMGLLEPSVRAYRMRIGDLGKVMNAPTIHEQYYTPLHYQPGTLWAYNSGHDWAGKVIEKVTSKTLDDLLRENIGAPLGANSLTFWPKKHPEIERKLLQVSKRGKDSKILKSSVMGLGPDDEDAPLFPAPEYPGVANTDCFGGGGASASMPDYLKVLHSLLSNDGKLLKRDTVKQMFEPQLSPAAREHFNQLWHSSFSVWAPGEYPSHQGLDWGIGAMLIVDDDPDFRAKGTLMWSGATNLIWFVSPAKGLCGIFGTQLMPSGDNKTKKLMTMWEKEMYRLAAASNK